MDGLPINITDLAIAVVILVSGGLAFVRGFVHELLSVAAWIGAAVATVMGLPYVLPYARDLIAVKLIADIVAGVGIFILVLVALSIITHWFGRRVRESSLGAVDRSLGLLFGFLRGAVLICLAWLLLLYLMPREDHPVWIAEARALPLVERGANAILEALPEDLKPELAPGSETAEPAPAASVEDIAKPEVSAQPQSDSDGAGPDDATGYKDDERKDLQRLIDSVQ